MSRKKDWFKLLGLCILNAIIFGVLLALLRVPNEIGAGLGFLEGMGFAFWAIFKLDLP